MTSYTTTLIARIIFNNIEIYTSLGMCFYIWNILKFYIQLRFYEYINVNF